jgi:Spy/CpxP family protein refolding chaperone
MKQTVIILILQLFMVVSVSAQGGHQKFSPEKFDADMEKFVTEQAKLTQQEADKFFPLFREMHKKQRAVYHKIRQATKQQPADDKACETTLKECDKLNIELRQIEQSYHQKMMKAVPAKKVYDAIMAENNFHRRMMRGGFQAPNGFNGFQGWQNPFGQQRGRRR